MLEELILDAVMREYTFCVNESCVEYECKYAPRYVQEGQVWTVHTPCLTFDLACPDNDGNIKPQNPCDLGGITLESISNGLVIRLED